MHSLSKFRAFSQISQRVLASSFVAADGNATSAENLRPYEEIPTVPGGLPFIGNFYHLFKKPHGVEKFTENIKELLIKHDTDKLGLIRVASPLANPEGDGRTLIVVDPDEGGKMYQAEGLYPFRGSAFDAIKTWRNSRPQYFSETIGVVVEEGEGWQKIRSKVQQDMMRVKSAMFYVDELQKVGADFAEYLEHKLLDENRITPDDFLLELYNYGLEGIGVVALDTRMGCFNLGELDPEIKRAMVAIRNFIEAGGDIILKIPFWKLAPRLDPTYNKMSSNLDIFAEFAKKKIDEARAKIEAKNAAAEQMDSHEISVLEKLIIKCGPQSNIPFVMAFDMVGAGIDTTGATSAFILYHLACNPDAQDRLREEIIANIDSKTEKVTESGLNKMKYMKACLKESLRLNQVVGGGVRRIREDTEMKGFRIPKNTDVIVMYEIAGRDPRYFVEPDKFRPERWMRENPELKNIPPFASLPFGHGPRMCIGKRFAEVEIYLLLVNLITRYNIEWVGKPNLGHRWKFLNSPDQPMKFKFNKI